MALGSNSPPGGKDGWCVGLTILAPSFADFLKILGASSSWSLKDLSRPVMGQIYFHLLRYLIVLMLWNL